MSNLPASTQLVSGRDRIRPCLVAGLEEQSWKRPAGAPGPRECGPRTSPPLPGASDKGTFKQVIDSQPLISQIKALRSGQGKSHG